jgi:hypothetical protein
MRSEALFRRLALLGAALALSACTAGASVGTNAAAPERTDPQMLKVSGEPRACISNRGNVSSTPAGDSVLMFRTGANTWFRNDLRSRCPGLSRDAILVFRSSTSQHCDMDLFDIVDRVSRINFGTCSLGRFTPVEVPRGTRF